MKAKSPRSAIRRAAAAALLIWIIAASAQKAHAVSIVANPTSLAMSALSGDPSDVQTISITSSGANFSFTVGFFVSTPSQIGWLSVDKRSGTTPATLTVTANPLGLGITSPQGMPPLPVYQASITIVAQGTSNSPVTIPVTFDVPGLKQLAVDPLNINFSAAPGSTPAAQSVEILSEGTAGGELVYIASATSDGNFLSVSPSTGLTPRVMNVSADTTNLVVGNTYKGVINVNDTTNAAVNLRQISVFITVTTASPPAISLAPMSLAFASNSGSSPPTQSFQISNAGSGTFNWTATPSTTSGGNWLSASPASGSTPSTVTVTVNSAALNNGNYSGKITISSAGVGNSPQVVNVTLVVGSQPTISFSPAGLFFSTSPGTNPPPQNFQVTNSGTGVLGWSAAFTSPGNYLSVGPTSGTAPSTLTATVNSSAFSPGNYPGVVTLTSPNASNSPQTVSALLTVSNNAPIANQNGVVNGGSFSLDATVAPNTIASLFGGRMSNDLFTAQTLPLPAVLGTTQVFVNGVAAPLFFVSNTQINFQMPPEVTGNTALVNVVFNGATSAPITVNLAPAVPGIFTRDQQGTGAGAVLNADNTPNSPANPVPRGGTVVIFATGLGATNPPVAAGLPGNVAEPFNRLIATPQVTIGGIDAHVDFAAVAPGFVGEYQVNAVVPLNVVPGSAVNVQITAGGKNSNIATIAVN